HPRLPQGPAGELVYFRRLPGRVTMFPSLFTISRRLQAGHSRADESRIFIWVSHSGHLASPQPSRLHISLSCSFRSAGFPVKVALRAELGHTGTASHDVGRDRYLELRIGAPCRAL